MSKAHPARNGSNGRAFGFGGGGSLTRREIKKSTDQLYRQSFGDLPEETIYRDVLGFRTADGKPSQMQKRRWEQFNAEGAMPDGSSIVQKWDELQEKGFSLEQTFDTIQKSLDTGDWTLPLDILPEVFVVNPEQTPAWDFIARETTQDDSVAPTPLTEHPDFHWGLEGDASTDGDGNRVYEYEQAEYEDPEFEVVGCGAATRLSDKMILASQNLRSAESTQEQAFVRGAALEGERQIIRGTDNDATGFQGFNDLGQRELDADYVNAGDPDPDAVREQTLELVDEVEHSGADLSSVAVFCDFDWHRQLREAYTDIVRYSPGESVDVDFATFAIEGGLVPVFKTNAIPRLRDLEGDETHDQCYAVNMEAVYMAMLQEVNVGPLARLGPQERFSVDFYGTLVDESNGEHIQIGEVETTAA